MKIAYQLDGVTHLQRCVLTKEVADGDIGGAPQRMGNQTCQLLVEKQRGTLVGEYDGYIAQIVAIFLYDVLGYVCQE